MNGKNVVFGKVDLEKSFDTLKHIEEEGTKNGDPSEDVRIVDCGGSRVVDGVIEEETE